MAGKAPKVGAHPLVEALVPDPGKPPQQALKLLGLPGASPSAGATRLWLDADLTSYVDVPDDAILYAKELPDDAGTILWVSVDANLAYGSVSSHAAQAGFLGGAIASAHLGGAVPSQAGAGPMPPMLTGPSFCGGCPTQLGGPCPSLPVCPTQAPSQCIPCFTTDLQCHTVAVCPSLFGHLCPTQPPICTPLTQDVRCPSNLRPCLTIAGCPPTHVANCPSVHVICPTPSAQLQCPSVAACPSVQIICPTPTTFLRCPTQLCPSVTVPCLTNENCPSAFCPPQSLACGGGPGGGFGPVGG